MAVTETGRDAGRALDDLYRAHGAQVYRYALAVLGNHADAEDVTQTAFLSAYRALEQGVRPRKPANWLLTITSNAIKERFRREGVRPQQVALDEEIAGTSADEEGPSVGELLTALSKIPPQQRQAIVLREFEGRSYAEISEILGVTTSALETLLFRARRSLAEELEHQLTCTEAQLAISKAADRRLGRKERRRLREHLGECPDCARFARLQQRHRSALKGLALVPIPVSLSLFRGLEGTAAAAALPAAASVGTVAVAGTTAGLGGATAAGGGALAGGVALKAAAVVAAAAVTGGVAVTGATENGAGPGPTPVKAGVVPSDAPGQRLGQVAPRGVTVPGKGVAKGKSSAPGQATAAQKATKGAAARAAKSANGKQGASESGTRGTSAKGQTARESRSTPAASAKKPTASSKGKTTTTKPAVKKAPAKPAGSKAGATPKRTGSRGGNENAPRGGKS